MERITKRAENGKAYMVESFASLTTGIWLAIDKLAEYEDAEEQGLLLRLPCNVGDTVWCIMTGMTGKHPILFAQEFELSMVEHFGKAVFLTKEEAKQKLESMRKE